MVFVVYGFDLEQTTAVLKRLKLFHYLVLLGLRLNQCVYLKLEPFILRRLQHYLVIFNHCLHRAPEQFIKGLLLLLPTQRRLLRAHLPQLHISQRHLFLIPQQSLLLDYLCLYFELLLCLLEFFPESFFFFAVLVDHLLGQCVLFLNRHDFD